jgi:NAD(P)-dependent dehydrogenase (short-subunit alcohol dehydrogenase family)
MEKKFNKNFFSLEKKTALVIGGSGYLGFEMSKSLFLMGARIIIASRNKKNFDKNIKKFKFNLKEKKKIKFLKLNISNYQSINSFYKRLVTISNSKIDILINCAWNGKKNTLESINDKDWDHDINISLSSTFKITKKLLPLLKLSKGKIINIASMYGHVAPDYKIYDNKNLSNPPSYGAAKAGIIQLTKYLASYLSPYMIKVNSISPGAFPFPSTIKKFPKFINKLKKKSVLGRIGNPKDLSGIIVLLCSEAGDYINGQNICVDGGWSIR